MPQNFIHTALGSLRQRTYLRETFGDTLKAFHVLIQLRYQSVIGITLLQYLHPSHKTGYGRAQLMGRFLRQAHPHLVLFGTL